MSTDRDLPRSLRSWLHEDRHEHAEPIVDTVLAQVSSTPQRRSRWSAGRDSRVNKYLKYGLVAAAVVLIAVVAINLLPGSPPPGGEPSATPEPSVAAPSAEPSPSAAAGLPVGSSFLLSGEEPPFINVTIPGPGWTSDGGILVKDGNGGAPDGVFVLGAWVGEPLVPSDPCHWASTMPDTPATTLEEIVAALGSQATRDASAPVDVTVDGHPGKSITLHVPADIAYSAGEFTDCDESKFCTLGFPPDGACYMWYMGPDEFQEIWIVDVEGEFIYVMGNYFPETPAGAIEEAQAILGSMTFSQ